MRRPSSAITLASLFIVASVIAGAGQDSPSRVTAAGGHWPGAGLFGSGAIHTNTTPKYTVYAQRRDKPGAIEVHDQDTDIILIMNGSATLVTGGTVVGRRQLRPNEWTGTAVENGVTTEVSRGDVIIVPKGTVHWFKDVRGSIGYYAVKVNEPDAPAAEPPGARIWTRAQAFAGAPALYDGKTTHRYQLFAMRRDKPSVSEVHDKETDIVFVLDGAGTWMVGGTPAGGNAPAGAGARRLAADDASLVPPGVAHWFSDAQQLTYYVIRVY